MKARNAKSTRLILVAVLTLFGQQDASARGAGSRPSTTQSPIRIALIGFQGAATEHTTSLSTKAKQALADALVADSRISMLDPALVRSAMTGIAYDGSINMSRDEARRIGSAIGCDFFVIGKADAFSRSDREKESHEEALIGVMIVDGRSGELAVFDFIGEKAPAMEAAIESAAAMTAKRASGYVDRLRRFLASRQTIDPQENERIEDAPDEGSVQGRGYIAPGFLNRVKPEYTEAAERADVTATVEAAVVFRANGEIGKIEVRRWAGFGLEESAIRAISQLKFKPATRDGKPISVRAMVRYNFRRLDQSKTAQPRPADKPVEKPEKDLREIFKPTYRRPPE